MGNMANPNEILGFLHAFYGLGATLSPLIATTMITKGRGLPWYYFYYVMVCFVSLFWMHCHYSRHYVLSLYYFFSHYFHYSQYTFLLATPIPPPSHPSLPHYLLAAPMTFPLPAHYVPRCLPQTTRNTP
jgi:hypothetical protein